MDSISGAMITRSGPGGVLNRRAEGFDWPVLICLLGSFRLLKVGQPVAVRSGGKTETLLSGLALGSEYGVPRDTVLNAVWPDNELVLAGQSLHSLVYSLNKSLADALAGAATVLHEAGCYRLNVEAGVAVDVACLDALLSEGDRHTRAGNRAEAAASYKRAVSLYRGDLRAGTDIHAVLARERLRAVHLTLLARLADYQYDRGDHGACLEFALAMLNSDPCREDAHRLLMRCYVKQGERAQALRQYRVCAEILRAEFDAEPEPTTAALFEQIRRDPGSI